MKVIRIITAIIVFVSMALILACSEEKTASLEGHEDIVAVLQKLPQCLFNPTSLNEIFLEDAVLICIHHSTHKTVYKGIKEIGTFHKDAGKDWHNLKTIPKRINVVNGQAEVDYAVSFDVGEPGQQSPWTCKGTAKMVKKGSNWMIKEANITGT